MTRAADLHAVTRLAGDVVNLAAVAAELVAAEESGQACRVHVLGAVLRALHAQALATHKAADEQWTQAHRAEQAQGGVQ